jgi:hypothetical protein
MTVSPRLKPRDVASLFSEAQSWLVEKERRFKAMSQKSADLAVFAFEINDGRTWAEAMSAWNRAHPNNRYESRHLFSRDSRTAFERITGENLEWKGGTKQ